MADTGIMIVEDETIVAKDLQQRLKALGYGVTAVASCGQEAIAKAGATRPNLILMDIRLNNGMDGIEAADQIRTRFGIPVIYLTAYADEYTLQRAKITEPFGYILKPFEERELQTTIEIALYKYQAEQELRESEARYRDLFENSQGLIAIHELDGTLMTLNPAAARALGYEPAELIGHNLRDCIAPNMRPFFDAYLARLRQHRRDQGLMHMVTRAGESRVWEYRNALYEENGKPPYCIGYAQDVTERERAEQAMRQQNEYLTALHETTLGLMGRLELKELLQAIISHAGKLVGTDHGYVFLQEPGENEIEMRVGVGEYTGFVGTRAKAGSGLAGTVWQTGEPLVVDDYRTWPGRLTLPSRDILRAVVGVPLRSGGQTVGVIGLAYLEEGRLFDHTAMQALARFAELASLALDNARLYAAAQERVNLERKLQETQKLESLGVLAGGIAHDFNNLLVSVLGNVGLVLLDLEPTSPVRDAIEQIKIAAQRAADLTKQMLAYSGRGRFVMQPVNLNAIIREMTQLLKVSISKNATLKFNLAESLPHIEADATQMRQIVMNLITNASDAIGNKPGVITLTTGLVNADRTYLAHSFAAPELRPGKYVYLEVADTGIGMDTETVARIFDPFFTTKFTGRGLGLAAVLGILRGHHGAIKVYSEPGHGSVFRILLPTKEEPAESQSPGEPLPNSGEGTILVIDDEEVVRMVTRRMLERFGYTPLVAEDGQMGLQILRAHNDEIVCILLDMTMPRMSGEETFAEIIKVKPEAKVLLMSGYTEAEANQRFKGAGLAGFMQKPYTPEELHEKVQKIIKPK